MSHSQKGQVPCAIPAAMHQFPMKSSARAVSLSVLSLSFCLGAAPEMAIDHVPSAKADGSISVTSDSREYCLRLSRNVQERMQTPHGIPVSAMDDARHLHDTGTALCNGQHVRAGIERLRRALVLLNTSQERQVHL
ncbi:hypothetical protein [Gluconobacter wancherniae]|uniref:hypothetical protein n=1 Tax=Gluconobacter wancherniae TaxID=1307955 RepID=UPI002012A974|nr:hypothetical protein [Gluconobacter wancherniae]